MHATRGASTVNFKGMHVLLFGAPGAGKSALGKLLAKEANYTRYNVQTVYPNANDLQKAADSVFNQSEQDHRPVVIESDPRNYKLFDKFFQQNRFNNKVCFIYLEVNKETAIKRVVNRLECPSCQKTYSRLDKVQKCKNPQCDPLKGNSVPLEQVSERINAFFGSDKVKGTLSAIYTFMCHPTFKTIKAESSWRLLKEQYRKLFFLNVILHVGAPIVDNLFNASPALIQRMGVPPGSHKLVSRTEFDELLKSDEAKDRHVSTGGSGCNTIAALAHLQKYNTAFLGCVGNDKEGDFFTQAILSAGVDSRMIKSDLPTSGAACLITKDGDKCERTFIVSIEASSKLNETHLTPEAFTGVSWVHLVGYTLYEGGLFEDCMKKAKDQHATISFDLGAPGVIAAHKQRVFDQLQNVKVLFGDHLEIQALTDKPFKEGMLELKQKCSIVVVKVGADGCWVASGNTFFHCKGISPKALVDVTGAGDNFGAAFLFALFNKLPLEVCAHFANLAGSATVEHLGAQLPAQKWEELLKTYKELMRKTTNWKPPVVNHKP